MEFESKPQALADRQVNTSSPSRTTEKGLSASDPISKMSSAEERKQEQNETYISPSDALLSPTTKKLNEMKGKRFGSNSIKPQSLFAKTVDKQAQSRQPDDTTPRNNGGQPNLSNSSSFGDLSSAEK